MATSTDKTTTTLQEDHELYTIEASVVTGFEESARGEAKERFGTDVMAARGKITWKVPLNKVKDVLEMGSVDNCRVVIHSVPCFHFTDQHDSLARLQKMVRDINWEAGLKAWQCIYNFPYPLVSRPDNPPSADDLVDVVIITSQPPPKDISAKKNKKKGWWGKRKLNKKGEDGSYKNDIVASHETGINAADDMSRPESECLDREGVREFGDVSERCSKSLPDQKVEASNALRSCEIEENGLNEADISSIPKVEDDVTSNLRVRTEGVASPNSGSSGNFQVDHKIANHAEWEGIQTDHENSRQDKPIVTEPGHEVQETGIYTVTETPRESNKSQSSGSGLKLKVEKYEETATEISNLNSDGKASPQIEPTADVGLSVASRKIRESEFASSVIKRLTSPTQSASGEEVSGADSPKMSCVTPPPTPIRSGDNPFFGLQDRLQTELLPFLDNIMKFPDRGSNTRGTQGNLTAGTSSSVDPSLSAFTSGPQSKNIFLGTNCVSSNNSNVPLLSTLAESANAELNFGSHGVPAHASRLGQQVFEVNLGQEESSLNESTVPVKKERDKTKPTFRVTCNRIGDHHQFDSASAAASLGSAIITYLNWQVDLKNFDIEVMLNIDHEEVTVALALTKMSLHYRNLVAFGPTSLRATICCNMLRLCRIKNGDFVCDPMCGTSAIPIEGALNWANCYHLGGDKHDKAIEKTIINMAAIQDKMKMKNGKTLKLDAVQWDVQHLPLRNKCVDVFVSDLPFGHRIGKKSDNRALYSSLLSEMARTARTGARACLLTEDKANLIKAIQTFSKYWQRRLILNINIGGLSGFVFLLTRTTAAVADTWSNWRGDESHTSGGSNEGETTLATTTETAPTTASDA